MMTLYNRNLTLIVPYRQASFHKSDLTLIRPFSSDSTPGITHQEIVLIQQSGLTIVSLIKSREWAVPRVLWIVSMIELLFSPTEGALKQGFLHYTVSPFWAHLLSDNYSVKLSVLSSRQFSVRMLMCT